MEEQSPEETRLIKIEEISLEKMSLAKRQQAEQLYHQLGLDPVVNEVLKEFSNSLTGMDRVTDKVFGPYDIKGRAEAVAKVTALITYAALAEQYDKEVGKLESEITTLEEERDQVRTNYDNLVEKVADVVGGDYDKLKANYNELVDRLAEVEHLRSQIATLNREKTKLTEKYESQITTLKNELEQLKENYAQLTTTHEALTQNYDRLRTAVTTVAGAIPYDKISNKLGEELYAFLLKDSKVPDMVIDGVGRFIDFKKYLGMAAEKGAQEAGKHAEERLSDILTE